MSDNNFIQHGSNYQQTADTDMPVDTDMLASTHGNPTSPRPAAMPFNRRLLFGVGHVLNDLCSSMWFSYLLIYLTKVIRFSNRQAGMLIMIGQVSDGLATPFIGYESDRTKKGYCSYGKRKSWHLLGMDFVILNILVII